MPRKFKVFCTMLALLHIKFMSTRNLKLSQVHQILKIIELSLLLWTRAQSSLIVLKKKQEWEIYLHSAKKIKNGRIENNNSILLAWMAQRLAKVYSTWQLANSVQPRGLLKQRWRNCFLLTVITKELLHTANLATLNEKLYDVAWKCLPWNTSYWSIVFPSICLYHQF